MPTKINIKLDLTHTSHFQGISDSQLIEWVIANRGHFPYIEELQAEQSYEIVVIHADMEIPFQPTVENVGVYIDAKGISISCITQPGYLNWKTIYDGDRYVWADERNCGVAHTPNHPSLGALDLRKVLAFLLRTAHIDVPAGT